MSPTKQLEAFAQSIYLTRKGRYFDDIEQEDGQAYIAQVIDWTNMFVDELKNEVDPSGEPVNWWFSRATGYEIGTALQGEASIDIPVAIDRVIADEQRYVQVTHDGIVISNWVVVQPKDISSRTDRITQDMCAVVGTKLVFSRAFRDTENNGSIIGDVILDLPQLSKTNVKLLTTVRPKLLLILGVSKNATLPDIVQGGLSPSYAQKFDTLLTGAIARSTASSISSLAARDDYGSVRGLY